MSTEAELIGELTASGWVEQADNTERDYWLPFYGEGENGSVFTHPRLDRSLVLRREDGVLYQAKLYYGTTRVLEGETNSWPAKPGHPGPLLVIKAAIGMSDDSEEVLV